MIRNSLIALKNHPFFDGIDWRKVNDRGYEPPFEPVETKINWANGKHITEVLDIDNDDEIDATLIDRFRSEFKHGTLEGN